MVYCKLVLVALIWGTTFIVGRVVVQQISPVPAAFCRFAIATLCLLLITYRTEGKLPRLKLHLVPLIVLLGLTGVFAYNVLFFIGLQTVPASRAALIVALNPIMVALGSTFVLEEKMRPLRWLGIAISLVGTAIVIAQGNPMRLLSGAFTWGDLYILGCPLCWAIYTLISKRVIKDLSPFTTSTYACLVGMVALFAVALPDQLIPQMQQLSPMIWLALAYLGCFSSAIAFGWYNEGLQAIGAARASVFINLIPLFAILLAAIFLKEPITLSLVTGGALVVAGVFLTNHA